jgi:hypothetical protein
LRGDASSRRRALVVDEGGVVGIGEFGHASMLGRIGRGIKDPPL